MELFVSLLLLTEYDMKGPPRSNNNPKSIYDTKRQSASNVKKKDNSLPADYVPGDDDVICGRGKECMDHIGNMKFRTLVKEKLDRYSSASNKTEKSLIIMETINEVREQSPFGGFIRRDNKTGTYFEAGDFIAVSLSLFLDWLFDMIVMYFPTMLIYALSLVFILLSHKQQNLF
jgi:hypothetical protein